MKSANYKELMKKVMVSNETELYCIISRRLDGILSKSNNKSETVRALLYLFESKSKQTVFYSIISICFAALIGLIPLVISLLSETTEDVFWEKSIICVCLSIVVITALIASKVGDKEEERTLFVLGVIKEKYEEIKNEKVSEMSRENEREFYVTVSSRMNDFVQKRSE